MMIQLDATGRPDESLALEIVGPLQPNSEENVRGKMLSFSLQKGHLRANACYLPLQSVNLEVLSFSLRLIVFFFPSFFFGFFVFLFLVPCPSSFFIWRLLVNLLNTINQVRHLPLDELELGSLRGTIQRVCYLLDC